MNRLETLSEEDVPPSEYSFQPNNTDEYHDKNHRLITNSLEVCAHLTNRHRHGTLVVPKRNNLLQVNS